MPNCFPQRLHDFTSLPAKQEGSVVSTSWPTSVLLETRFFFLSDSSPPWGASCSLYILISEASFTLPSPLLLSPLSLAQVLLQELRQPFSNLGAGILVNSQLVLKLPSRNHCENHSLKVPLPRWVPSLPHLHKTTIPLTSFMPQIALLPDLLSRGLWGRQGWLENDCPSSSVLRPSAPLTSPVWSMNVPCSDPGNKMDLCWVPHHCKNAWPQSSLGSASVNFPL